MRGEAGVARRRGHRLVPRHRCDDLSRIEAGRSHLGHQATVRVVHPDRIVLLSGAELDVERRGPAERHLDRSVHCG